MIPESATGWVIVALALYGGALAAAHLWQSLRTVLFPAEPAAFSMMVLVQNQEHHVEGLVRSLARYGGAHSEIVVVDSDSRDQTPLIMERLCRQSPGVRFVGIAGEEASRSPCEAGLSVCRNRVVLLLDARGATDVLPLLQTTQRLTGAQLGRRME